MNFEVKTMSSQYFRTINVEPSAPQTLIPKDSKLLSNKISNISHLVSVLSAAVEDLEALELPQLDDQFDFYEEVERFQINLIKSALRVTGGSQVKAARLLKLKATTLNAKMKLYRLIER